jgi:hypothetical protein
MPYLIDGHNLIPKIPGLSLSAIDDEMQLVELLQEFCRVGNKQVDVYFDHAPAGQAVRRVFGRVTAHFVPQASSADQAIRARLYKLGRSAKNWIVISSDQAIRMTARTCGAQTIASETFAQTIMKTLQTSTQIGEKPSDTALNHDEVDEWLRLFNQERRSKRSSD